MEREEIDGHLDGTVERPVVILVIVAHFVEEPPVLALRLVHSAGNKRGVDQPASHIKPAHKRVSGVHVPDRNLFVAYKPFWRAALAWYRGQVRRGVEHAVPRVGDGGRIIEGAQRRGLGGDDHLGRLHFAPRGRVVPDGVAPLLKGRFPLNEPRSQDTPGDFRQKIRHRSCCRHLDVNQSAECARDLRLDRGEERANGDFRESAPGVQRPKTVAVGTNPHGKTSPHGRRGDPNRDHFPRWRVEPSAMPAGSGRSNRHRATYA